MADLERDSKQKKPKKKGLLQTRKEEAYDKLLSKVKLSVRTLDIIIGVCVVLLVVVLIHGYANRGFDVTFDSKGGTDVASQVRMYDEYLDPVEPPTREGYEFVGWYRDEACTTQWHMEIDTVEEPMTLYAKWEPIQ